MQEKPQKQEEAKKEEDELPSQDESLGDQLEGDIQKDAEFGNDDEKYSDIDQMFEKKLKTNQIQNEEDVFDELVGGVVKDSKLIFI
jgi:hypothetical protein